MRQLARLIKTRHDASAAALGTSAALPNSGLTFVDNSQGASVAVAELSVALGDALEQIDLEGESAASALQNDGWRALPN